MAEPSYIAGVDGWMFLSNRHQFEYDQAIGRHALGPDFVRDWVRTLGQMARCCERRGAHLVPVIAPAKASIYLDKVPLDDADKRPARSPMSLILEAANAAGLNVLDLRPALTAARSQAETYSRLNSHWTEFGGWVAWTAIAAHLERAMGGLELLQDLEVSRIEEHDTYNEMRDLFGVEGANNWTRPVFDVPLPPVTLVQPDGSCTSKPGHHGLGLHEIPVDVHSPEALNDLRCLVLGDSTVSSVSPWLNRHFAQVSYRNHHIGAESRCTRLFDDLDDTRARIVFYIMTERYCAFQLHEPDLWSALEHFETKPATLRYAWPFRSPSLPLACVGRMHLDTPNLVHLPRPASSGTFSLRVSLTSEGQGLVMSAYTTRDGPQQKWHRVRAGLNHTFLDLPCPTDGNHLWLVRDKGMAPVMLTALELQFDATAEPG